MSPSPHPQPSARAREVVRGGTDLHVHSGPDVMARSGHDLEIALRFREVGMNGYVIKHHYAGSVGRARLASLAVPGVDVMGSIVLNSAVGGMNAMAVEMAAREGARIVWFPTVDAENEPAGRTDPQPGAKLPFWAKLQHQLRAEGLVSEPVPVVDGQGAVLPEVVAVLKTIAKHDLILATAHLGRDEIFTVVDAARTHGVERIVITHPEFPSQDLAIADQIELAKMGALLERCLTTPLSGKCSWERIFEATREVGVAHSFVSTDLGQPENPPVEDGLAIWADRLLEAGFSEDDVRRMAVETPWALARGSWRAAERARS